MRIAIGMCAGLFLLVVVIALVCIGIYNSLVAMRNRYKNAFAQIDVQLKRRYDLIPNLVETAKGYMKHERETLEAVIQARNAASQAGQQAAAQPGDPKAMRGLMSAETQLGGAIGRMFALAESYPDLSILSMASRLTCLCQSPDACASPSIPKSSLSRTSSVPFFL